MTTSSEHIEFTLLSMTEVRNRPGEILDRVADSGQAFIIERNGHRKACLVPLSVFFPDIPTTRIADELNELAQQKEEPRTGLTDSRELALRFGHVLADKTSVEVKIVLPHGYPNRCPRVYAKPLQEDTPHRWADGALCLFGVQAKWNPGTDTVASTLALARSWLQHYETWLTSGRWPKPEAEHGRG